MNRAKQLGFAPILIVVAVVAVIVVGGLIIWRVIDNRESTPTEQSQTSTQSNDSSKGLETDPNDGYVVIAEWGVRFRPKTGLSGVEYFKPKNVESDAISFTTTSLTAKESRCSKVSGAMVLGLLTRSKDPQASEGGVIVTIDGYSYQYRVSGAVCSETDEGMALESKVLSDLAASLKTIEPME